MSPAAAETAGSLSGIPVAFIQKLKRSSVEGLKGRVLMACSRVREKQGPMALVELLAKAQRIVRRAMKRAHLPEAAVERRKAADWRPPLLEEQQGQATLRRATLRQALLARPE